MRSAHPAAVAALYAVVAIAVVMLAVEVMAAIARRFGRGLPPTRVHTDEYNIDTLRAHARRRAADYHARRTGGAA